MTPSRTFIKMRSRAFVCAAISVLFLLGMLPADVFSQADFYRGKTITIIQDSSAGGVGNLRTNAVIASLKKHVPGNPNIVIQFMEGAGGAFRSKGAWYQFSFTCTVTPDRMKVLSFSYKTGEAIPESKWANYGLWR